ncbi:MAG: hypothetical protein ABI614_18070 [Planctomycetota bacterium]
MSATLQLDDQLQNALQRQAEPHNLSWDQFALIILSEAANPAAHANWNSLNQRRLELIGKKYNGGLTEADLRELAALQAVAEKHLEPLDGARLKWLEQIETRVEQLRHADE